MLELRLLRAHVERCAPCARLATDIEVLSLALRAAPLEPLSEPITIPSIRRRTVSDRIRGSHLVGQLALVAASGLLAFSVGSWSSGETIVAGPAVPILIDAADLAAVDAEPTELRVFRHAALISETSGAPRVGKHPGSQPL